MQIQELKKKSWSQLSIQEKEWLKSNGYINGCGGKGGYVQPPNFFFLADCNHHDWKYTLGGGIKEYWMANWQFFMAMIKDVNRISLNIIFPFQQVFFLIFFVIALNYFIAVTIMGWKFFNWK